MAAVQHNSIAPGEDLLASAITGDNISATLATLLDRATAFLDEDRAEAKACIRQAAALLSATTVHPDVDKLPPKARHTLAPWLTRRVTSYIDANLGTPIRSGDLVNVSKLSTSYFFRAFKGSFGKSPHAYIASRRIARAQQMMIGADAALCQIAVACGFSDQAHFSRMFRREIGKPPGVWRREQLGGVVGQERLDDVKDGEPASHERTLQAF